jgi:hypothetical protein
VCSRASAGAFFPWLHSGIGVQRAEDQMYLAEVLRTLGPVALA